METYWVYRVRHQEEMMRIDQRAFERVSLAIDRLSALLEIEEAFSLFAESAIEIERFLLLSSLEQMVSHERDEFDWLNFQAQINLRYLSLLTAAGGYCDVRSRRVKILGGDDMQARCRAIYAEAYEACVEYRLMEALRNYAKHHGFAIHGSTHGGIKQLDGRNYETAKYRVRQTVPLYFSVAKLLADKEFKASLKVELRDITEPQLDARYFTRTYVARMTSCHLKLREELQFLVDASREALSQLSIDWVAFANPEYGRDAPNISIAHESGGAVRERYASLQILRRLDWMQSRWSKLTRIDSHYVSSELFQESGVYTSPNSSVWII